MALQSMIERLKEAENELDELIERGRQRFDYTVERHKVRFETKIRKQHRQFRTSAFRYLVRSGFLSVLFAPVVYSLILPLALLDLFVSFFQLVCFPIYGIEKVKRADFIAIDRQHLAYLNWIEKLNCVYCGYANGLLAYTRAIAGRSEEHWCPIKHARRIRGQQPEYWEFADYGDPDGYKRKERQVARQHYRRIAKKWIPADEDRSGDGT